MVFKYGLPLLALALLSYTIMQIGLTVPAPQAPHPLTPAQSPYPDCIASAGVVEAQTENIEIGAPVPGIVAQVFVRPGQKVSKAEALFRLDDQRLRSELSVRSALLNTARAKLAKLEAEPRKEECRIKGSQVRAARAALRAEGYQLEHGRKLHEKKLLSVEEMGRLEQSVVMAQARLEAVEAENDLLQAGANELDRNLVRAEVAEAEAGVKQVQTELERLTVRAPLDGAALQVNVQPGKFVSTPALKPAVVIGNLDRLYLRVDIDEYDLARFRPQAPAQAALKSRPQQQFKLSFVRVVPFVIPKQSLSGRVGEWVDVRCLQVFYVIEPGESPLYVGQQLDVFIETDH